MCNTNHRLCCLYSCPQSKVNLMVFFAMFYSLQINFVTVSAYYNRQLNLETFFLVLKRVSFLFWIEELHWDVGLQKIHKVSNLKERGILFSKEIFKFAVNGFIDRKMGHTVDYIPSKVKAVFCQNLLLFITNCWNFAGKGKFKFLACLCKLNI